MDLYSTFNRKLSEFADDLARHVDPEFSGYKAMLSMTAAIDNKMPMKIFHDNICVQYEKDIIEKNDKVFLERSYEDMGADMAIVQRLKSMWHKIDDANKDIVWKYMTLLTLITNKCYSAK